MGRHKTGPLEEFIPRNKDIAQRYIEFEESLQRIGDRYGISRERVRQILDKIGIKRRPVGGQPNPLVGEECPICKDIMVSRKIIFGICAKCHTYKKREQKYGLSHRRRRVHELLSNCVDCGKDITQEKHRNWNRCNTCRTKNFVHTHSRIDSKYYIPKHLYPNNCLDCGIDLNKKKKARGMCGKCYGRRRYNGTLDPNFGKNLITQPLTSSFK